MQNEKIAFVVDKNSDDPIKSLLDPKRTKDYVFKLYGDFRVSDHGFIMYPEQRLSNTEIVYDKVSGIPRLMRLLNGVKTLWADEQEGIDEKVVGNMMPQDLNFVKGVMRVPAYNMQKAEFLLRKNCCLNNPNRDNGSRIIYYLVESEKSENELYDIEMNRQKARSLAADTPMEEMKYHCSFLNIPIINEYGEPFTEKGLRVKYMQYATDNAAKFMESFGTVDLKYNYLISRAITKNLIVIDRSKLEARWSSGKKISTLPEAQDPAKYLSGFAFTEEGKEFRDRLETTNVN